MERGERYSCGCGCMLEVIEPCTCEQKQDMVCTCGHTMRVMSAKE